MIDLGKHTFIVLSSYGVTLTLLAIIVAVSLHRARRIKVQLTQLEEKDG